jgi:acetyl-CoA carboxylase biotin carboxyl carrier protein
MDLKNIKALYKFIKGTDIEELEVEGPDGKVRIKRGAVHGKNVSAPEPATELAEVEKKGEVNEKLVTVSSPMVGTFYRAASPEASSFVETGAVIKTGQIICIIEAMKIMNEVESEYSGKIVSILVENGQPVEYGEPLFNVAL